MGRIVDNSMHVRAELNKSPLIRMGLYEFPEVTRSDARIESAWARYVDLQVKEVKKGWFTQNLPGPTHILGLIRPTWVFTCVR